MKYFTVILTALFVFTRVAYGPPEKKVFYLNSYHKGYGSSDDITEGIVNTLGDKVRLEIFYMDTKRLSEPAQIKTQVKKAHREIENFSPDVMIASDDNAVKYVIAPFYKNGPVPVVFCGVNWTCEQYGLPTAQVTGMLEVLPVAQCIELIKKYKPGIQKVMVISENTTSEQKNKTILARVFKGAELEPAFMLVDRFDQWKNAFKKADQAADLVFLPTNGAIKNWDKKEAEAFVEQNIRVPVFTCDDFMMPYAAFGLTKIAAEQGQWAASTALDILQGESPADIPVTQNQKTAGYINPKLLQKIGLTINEKKFHVYKNNKEENQ